VIIGVSNGQVKDKRTKTGVSKAERQNEGVDGPELAKSGKCFTREDVEVWPVLLSGQSGHKATPPSPASYSGKARESSSLRSDRGGDFAREGSPLVPVGVRNGSDACGVRELEASMRLEEK